MNKTTLKLSNASWWQKLKNSWKKSPNQPAIVEQPIISSPKESIQNQVNQLTKLQKTNESILHLFNTLTIDEQKKIESSFADYQSIWSNFQQYPNNDEKVKSTQELLLESMIRLKNHPEALRNHEKFMNWFNQLPRNEKTRIAKDMDKYLIFFDIYIKSAQVNLFTAMQDTLEIMRRDIVSLYEDVNLTSAENLALQHFQDTQAPSNLYVPIQTKNDYLGFGKLAFYTTSRSCITIGKEFREKTPTEQYKTILHEYRHHLQNINNDKVYSKEILKKAKTYRQNPSWLIYEHDADHFAIEHITCPTCLKILLSTKYNIKRSDGYFNSEDIEPFIKKAINNPCCPAHTQTPGDEQHNFIVQQLEKKLNMLPSYSIALFDTLSPETVLNILFSSSEFKKPELKDDEKNLKKLILEEIPNLDKQSGTLLAHIPYFNRDFIAKIVKQKEFQELLGAKLLKELDVRQTMATTEKLSQKKEFPLLEEHKLQPLILQPK